jgi:GTP cyclohydrolase I
VADLSELGRVVRERVIDHLDHKNIDLDCPFMLGTATDGWTISTRKAWTASAGITAISCRPSAKTRSAKACGRPRSAWPRALQYLTHGYDLDPAAILKRRHVPENYSQMVLVKDIEVYSLCEHHMLPFFGKAHVAYIPKGQITGLSKIPRVVDAFARRLQVQERLTNEIRDCIQDTLKPMGVAVVIECAHLCMQMRGIQKQNSVTTTSAFTGIFLTDHRTREEFIKLISAKLH